MAVVFEGFSIREYASKMRSIDVVKCWPFSGGPSTSDDCNGNSSINKQTMESLLPPITVTKFRWWSDELDLLKSTELANKENNKLQKMQPRKRKDVLPVNLHVGGQKYDERSDMLECPVCGAFAASTVNALNAHVDSCLAQACREERRQMRMAIKATKSKPKKRSIAEIFAAAPQIHKAVDADDDDCLDEDQNGSFNSKLNCKKKNKKVAIVKKLRKKKRKLKNKNKNKKRDDQLIANKENGSKLKQQTPVNFSRKPNDTLCSRGLNAISILIKKPSLKSLSAKKKSKILQTSKVIVGREKPSSHVRGILKNPSKTNSGQNASMRNLRNTTQASTCGVQHSARHVSFSEKGHQNGGDKEFLAREIDRSDEEDVSFSTENGIMAQATFKEQQLLDFHHNVDIPKFLRPRIMEQEKATHFSDRSLAPGQVALDAGSLLVPNQGYQSVFYSPPYTGVPRPVSSLNIQNPFENSQVCARVSTASNYRSLFVDYFGDHIQEVAISSKANPRVSSQPSLSGFALSKNANNSAPFTSQFALDNVPGHALSHQPLYCLSPVELRGRLSPVPEWKQKTVAFQEKYRDEEFFGLPLNSQGELVQANSSGKGGFGQLKKWSPVSGSSNSINSPVLPRSIDDHSIMKGKHFIESALPNNLLSLFPAQNHMKENTTVPSLARLGTTELQGHRKEDGYNLNSDRRCNCSIYSMDSDLNSMNVSFSGCRQYDQFQNQKDKGITLANKNADNMLLNSPRPTMRLMGKDVTICRSSNERQEFADGKIWTDKEIIKEHYPQSTALQNSYLDGHFRQDWLLDPASGKLKETPVERFEIESPTFPSNVLTRPIEPNFFQPFLNWQENSEFLNSSLAMARDPNPNSHNFACPPASHGIFDKGADIQEPFISRNETLRINSGRPAASTSQRNYQNVTGNCVELQNKQSLLNAGKSSFNFPFFHPDHVEHVQPSWFQGSSKSLIPWLFQATQQVKAPSTPSQPIPQVSGRRQLCTAQTSLLTDHVVPGLPVVSYDHNPMISSSLMESSVGHPSIAHCPLIPQVPGIKPTSSVNTSHRNRSNCKDRMKSKCVNNQDPDFRQKSRKRSEANDDYPMKLMKVPNVGIQNESRAAIRLTREKLIEDIQHSRAGSLEVEPERNERSVVGWIPDESQCNEFGHSAVIDSSKVDGVTRAGPIKLIPGVKHILKPSQIVDQDNSRLIHSTIPFASLTDCGSILEAQKKSTKIYRF
ncbi:hypothetical protein PTKIN_Ptkin07bG0074900 [Pterospermum kingtungense]